MVAIVFALGIAQTVILLVYTIPRACAYALAFVTVVAGAEPVTNAIFSVGADLEVKLKRRFEIFTREMGRDQVGEQSELGRYWGRMQFDSWQPRFVIALTLVPTNSKCFCFFLKAAVCLLGGGGR